MLNDAPHAVHADNAYKAVKAGAARTAAAHYNDLDLQRVCPMPDSLLDISQFDRPDTLVRRDPFPLIITHAMLAPTSRAALEADFPVFSEAGYFPYEKNECGASVQALVAELSAPAFARRVGAHLGMEHLDTHPVMVTLCRSLNRRHGTIHTDSASKVATALLYMNAQWADTSAGCLRFLSKNDDIDAIIVPEVKPLLGEFVAFKRTDCSFHGHLPFAGERRVIQVAWLTDAEALARKTRRGRFSRTLKHWVGSLDDRIGAKRGRNASHK